MKRQTKMQLMSSSFSEALHKLYPSAIKPDEQYDADLSGKAPDHFLPQHMIAIERKSISPNLTGRSNNGKKLNSSMDEEFMVFGTANVSLSNHEFRKLSDKMTGELRTRIKEAEEQLVEFCNDQDILSVCCLFVEITKKETFDWHSTDLPTRDMVRTSADLEFRRRDIDVLVLFTMDGRGLVCLDIIQAMYRDEYLQAEFEKLSSVLGNVFLELSWDADFSVTPATLFVPD